MTRIFTINDQLMWTNYVRRAAEYDFYHTWHYHSMEKTGEPLLFVFDDGDEFIAFPLLRRAIPGSTYYDLCCVYGYSGPFSNKKMDELSDSFMENFKEAFLNFLSNENYISVFARMHPFYKQQRLLEKIGGVHDNGLVVAFDLSMSIEEQRKKYRETTMDSIKNAWKKGFYMKEEKGPEGIALFTDMYMENMRRIGASDYYLFNEDYFNKILYTDEYEARILTVYYGDQPMSTTLITFANGIIQGHLLATRTDYLKYSPTKFLVDEITQLGRSMGMRYYNLGGGLGFKQDTLFHWKSAFSDLHLDYKSWRFVANPTVYQSLLDEKGMDQNTEIDFFPLYRYA